MSKCIVKNCIANDKNRIDKISIFKVPKDLNLREKWEIALGINIIQSSQRVCQLQFEKELVIKDYILKTPDGRIIKRIPLKCSRLIEGAVPTVIKNNDLLRDGSPSQLQRHDRAITLDHTYAKKISVDEFNVNVAISAEGSQGNFNREIQEETSSDVFSNSKLDATGCDKNATQCNSSKVDGLQENAQNIDGIEVRDNDNNKHSNFNDYSPTANVDDIISTSEEITNHVTCENSAQTHNSAINRTTMNLMECDSNVTFAFPTSCSLVLNGIDIQLPQSWYVMKCMIEKEEVPILRYVVESTHGQRRSHIPEKSVLITSSKEIIYEVLSRRVYVSETELPKILSDFKQLPEILNKFKDFKVCKASILRIITGMDVYRKDCSLLSYDEENCRSCKLYSISITRN